MAARSGRKKKRKASYYYALTISNDPKSNVKSRRYTHGLLKLYEIIVAVLTVAILCFVGYASYSASIIREREAALKETITALQDENSALASDNETLSEKVSILSETVNQKTEVVAQIEEKSFPTGFPLSGTAELKEKDEVLRIDGNTVERPMIEFAASNGTYVIAAGDGVVSLVAEESTYGWEVRIDHGNGYVTVYRTNTEPKVKQGDEVPRGGLLYEMEAAQNDSSAKMAYQIIKDEEYIKPTEMLKIEG